MRIFASDMIKKMMGRFGIAEDELKSKAVEDDRVKEFLDGKSVKKVVATDINKDCKKNLGKGIKFIHSNLFNKIPKQKFGTVIFNPPYLPQDWGSRDATIYGGKKGYEIIGSCALICYSSKIHSVGLTLIDQLKITRGTLLIKFN